MLSARSSLVVSLVLLCLVSAAAIAADADRAVDKFPPSIKQWEIALRASGGHSVTYPVRVFEDGRYECEVASDSWEMITKQGKLDAMQRDIIHSMGRSALSKCRIVPTGRGIDDVPNYHLTVRCGSRSVEVAFDPGQPMALGIHEEMSEGVRICNGLIRRHKNDPGISRFNEPFMRPDYQAREFDIKPGPVVPVDRPYWDGIEVRLASPDPDVKVDVIKGQGSTHLHITRYRTVSNERPSHETYDVSDEERDVMFKAARDIVNAFSFEQKEVGPAVPRMTCTVGISGGPKGYDVHFPIDDSLPDQWRSHLHRVSMMAHKRDGEFPIVPEKPSK